MSPKPRAFAFAACLMISALFVPTTGADSDVAFSENDPLTWGVEYQWTNLEEDVGAMTGLPLLDMIDDVTEAADYAGFNMTYVQVSSGTTLLYIDQWEGDDIVTITDADGDSHYVNQRYTKLTLRHGILFDSAVLMDWDDDDESIDAVLSADFQELFVIDALYVEYVTADLEIVGADLTLSGEVEAGAGFGFDAEIDAGGESIDWDIEVSGTLGFEIASLDVEMRLYEPNPIYEVLLNASDDDYVEMDCYDLNDNGSFTIKGPCGTISGTFSTASSYALSITGLPAHELGLAADALDLAISDDFTDTGSFSGEDFDFEMGYEFGAGSQTVVVDDDGTTLDVDGVYGLPLTPGMAETIAYGLMYAVDGSSNTISIGDVLEGELEDWAENIESEVGGGDVFVCDDGEEIPADWENDGEEDCDDGSDESEGGDTFVCDNGEEIPADWVNDGEDDCGDGSDEGVEQEEEEMSAFEQKLNTMGEALDESNIEKTLEAFGEKLENLLGDYEADVPYVDGDAFALWSDDEARFVGIMILAETDNGGVYNFLGPDSDTYSDAPVQISLTYLTGAAAALAEEEAEGDVTLMELAPVAEHDTTEVNEALGIDPIDDGTPPSIAEVEEESGSWIPAVSGLATLAVIGAGAIVAGLGRRKR